MTEGVSAQKRTPVETIARGLDGGMEPRLTPASGGCEVQQTSCSQLQC
jgi:hypothetical protein